MNEERRLERQNEIALTTGQKIAVVGVGGVGSWVAYFLGLAGVEALELFDEDVVSESNLNRLPVRRADVGQMKSLAVARLVNELRDAPVATARPHFEPARHQGILEGFDWVVACTDSLKSRRACHEFSESRGLNYIELSAEGEKAQVFFEPADFSTSLEDDPGYRSVPVYVGPCVIAASIACSHILHAAAHQSLLYTVDWDSYSERVKFTRREV